MSNNANEQGKKTHKELILHISTELKMRTSNKGKKKLKNSNNIKGIYSPIRKKNQMNKTVEVNKHSNITKDSKTNMHYHNKPIKLNFLFSGLRLDFSNLILTLNKTKNKSEMSPDNKNKSLKASKYSKGIRTYNNYSIDTKMNKTDSFKAFNLNDVNKNQLRTTSLFSSPFKKEINCDIDKADPKREEITPERNNSNNNIDNNKLLLKNPLVQSFDKIQRVKVSDVPLITETEPDKSVSEVIADDLKEDNKENTSKMIKRKVLQFRKAITSINSYSHVGYSGSKIDKQNQDSFCIIKNFLDGYEETDSYFLSVW